MSFSARDATNYLVYSKSLFALVKGEGVFIKHVEVVICSAADYISTNNFRVRWQLKGFDLVNPYFKCEMADLRTNVLNL